MKDGLIRFFLGFFIIIIAVLFVSLLLMPIIIGDYLGYNDSSICIVNIIWIGTIFGLINVFSGILYDK